VDVEQASRASLTYFGALELPEELSIDRKDLEARFYRLSRTLHPDRFARATPEEQQRALDASALLNDAYRALRDPVSRAEYLLSLKGIVPADSKHVPPELLEEVFDLNMALEEVKSGDADAIPQLRQSHQHFQQMLAEADTALEADFSEWDRAQNAELLDRLRSRLNHRKYISNLLRETEKALESHVSD